MTLLLEFLEREFLCKIYNVYVSFSHKVKDLSFHYIDLEVIENKQYAKKDYACLRLCAQIIFRQKTLNHHLPM